MGRQFESLEDFTSEYVLFSAICGQLWRFDGKELKELAWQADVCDQTLYNWRNGTTLTPRLDTLTRVARALGYEMTLKVSRRKAPKLRAV